MTAWELIERRRRRFVMSYSSRFRAALRRQILPVVEAINPTFIEQFEIDVPFLIKEDELTDTFYSLYEDVGSAFRTSLAISLKERGLVYNTKSMEDDLWREDMRAYAELVLSGHMSMMTETTKQAMLGILRQSIRDGRDAGLGIEKLATQVRNDLISKYGILEKYRARRIAQTEVLSASNYSSFLAAKDSGVPMKKRWLTAPPGLAKTERHTLLEPALGRQRLMMNEAFNINGADMMHPGDPAGGAENVINCRCAIGYEVM